MYSMLAFCATALIWLTLRNSQGNNRRWRLFLWVLVSVAGLLTHYFFLFVWLAAFFWLQLYPRGFSRLHSCASGLLTGLLVAPWYLRIPEFLVLRPSAVTMTNTLQAGRVERVKPHLNFH